MTPEPSNQTTMDARRRVLQARAGFNDKPSALFLMTLHEELEKFLAAVRHELGKRPTTPPPPPPEEPPPTPRLVCITRPSTFPPAARKDLDGLPDPVRDT